jgi:hypothetical protein
VPGAVYDGQGNGIDMIEQGVTETKVTPAQTIRRTHGVARLFKRMIDDGFDPRDPEKYINDLETNGALSGMPTEAEWKHNALSVGEMASRKWLAMEFLALVVRELFLRLKDHEQRIAALENAA